MGKKGKPGGKKPKGRAAQRNKTSPRSGGLSQSFAPRYQDFSDDDNARPQFRGFQGGTPKGNSAPRNVNVRLRHQAISFVSAGSSTPAESEEWQKGERELPADLNIDEDEDMEGDGYPVDDDDDEDDEEEDEDDGVDDSGIQTNIMVDTDGELAERVQGDMVLNAAEEVTQEVEASESLFVVDTTGDASLAAQAAPVSKGKQRAPSPARSDSSEEEVIFHGRNRQPTSRTTSAAGSSKPTNPSTPQPRKAIPPHLAAATRATTHTPSPKAASPQPASTPHITDDLLAALGETVEASRPSSSSPARSWAARASQQEQFAQAASSDGWQPASSTPYWRKGKPRPDLGPAPRNAKDIEDVPSRPTRVMFVEPEGSTGADQEVGAEETIASLQADWKQVLREKRASKDGAADLEVDELKLDLGGKKRSRKHKGGRKKDNKLWRAVVDSEDEDEEEAAYHDYMQNLAKQLEEDGELPSFTAVNAAAGPSLVVNGQEIADNEVLQHTQVEDDSSDSDDDRPIGQDVSDFASDNDLNYSDLESSDLEDHLEYTEREQLEDEEDLRQRRIDRMTDEKIARLFTKQQELGIDAETIVIDDGYYDEGEDEDDMEGIGDLEQARAGLADITNSAFGRSQKGAGSHRRRGNGHFTFPDASALADTVEQYGENGFDIMDFDRPSLRPTKKGRKGKLPPEMEELSDEDLKEELKGAWENDRAKKRLKKAEREALRAEGLLGASGKKGKADLSQKYREGMTMAQVMDELKAFLQDDGQTSRPFPPMDKTDRRQLHEVANALNLKSKSVGTGNNRFPVLYKTRFTVEYDVAVFKKVMYASSKGFLNNASRKGKKGKAAKMTPRAGRGGGFDKSATGLRNGQIVGADAPEIGAASFGHKLMEKMGWTKGTALGKDGEGLLVPVEQVMRSGKAGLG